MATIQETEQLIQKKADGQRMIEVFGCPHGPTTKAGTPLVEIGPEIAQRLGGAVRSQGGRHFYCLSDAASTK